MAHKIRKFEVEDGESDCDWLVFAKARTDQPLEYTPTNGHNVYFADTTLHTVSSHTMLLPLIIMLVIMSSYL